MSKLKAIQELLKQETLEEPNVRFFKTGPNPFERSS